jgi:hypothetical protein
MMDGDWIAMLGVPLITVEGSVAAAEEGGGAAGAPVYEAGAAEDTTAPTTEEGHGGGAPGPAAEGEQAEAAAGTAPSAPAGFEAAFEVTPAPVDAAAAAVPAGEDTAADASEVAHAAELEVALLAASSPGGDGPTEAAVNTTVASVEATEASTMLSEVPVVAEGAEV